MATRFTSSSYHLGSQVKLSTAKKSHPETGSWFLEAYSDMTNFRAKVTNSITYQRDEFNSQMDEFNSQSDEFICQRDKFNCKSDEFNCQNL